jgi:hypothetical protein
VWQWSIAMFKSGWDAVMGVRSLFRELKEKRDAMEDEEKVPQVIQCMDETEQKVRKKENLHSYVPVFDDEEWWITALPGVPRKLIRKAMQKRQEKRKRIDDLWNNR